MSIVLRGEGWAAHVITGSANDAGFFDVYCMTDSLSSEGALSGAKYVLNAFAFGRTCLIRVAPEVASEKDFATGVTGHRGMVRFSYKLESGEWHYPKPPANMWFGQRA